MTIMSSSRVASPKATSVATVIMLSLGIVNTPVVAEEWTFSPRISVSQSYSNNIRLQPEGQEQHDFVTAIEPGFFVRGNGRRLRLNMDYNLEALAYKRNDDPNAIRHQLQLGGDAELYERVLFLEFDGSRSQENSGAIETSGSDNLSASGNRTDVTALSLTPKVRHRFGRYADVESSYGLNLVSTDTNGQSTSSTARFSSVEFNSGDYFARAPWRVTLSNNRVKNSSGTVNRFRKFEGEMRYKLNRKYGVVVRGGQERNEFASTQPSQDGGFWEAGLTWTPSPRTSLEAGVGRRFFDENMFLNFEHRSRRMTYAASFSEDITTSRQQQLERSLVPLEDALGNPIIDPILGTQIEVPIDNLASSEEVIQVSRFDASAGYSGRKTRVDLAFFGSLRTGQVTGAESELFGLSVNATRTISRRASLQFRSNVQLTNSNGQETERISGGLTYRYQLGRSISTTLGLDYLTQDSTLASNIFDETRFRAGIVGSF
jgi:uncharacterized protein (PEP-CTERM system associated)